MIQQAAKHLTKIDTLEATIRILSHKLDSIEKVVSRNDIRAEFFHDNLSGQTMIYSAILSGLLVIAALISWQALYKPVIKKIDKFENYFMENIGETNASIIVLRGDVDKLKDDQKTLIPRMDARFKLLQAQALIKDEPDFVLAIVATLEVARLLLKSNEEKVAIKLLTHMTEGPFKIQLNPNTLKEKDKVVQTIIEEVLSSKASSLTKKLISDIRIAWNDQMKSC